MNDITDTAADIASVEAKAIDGVHYLQAEAVKLQSASAADFNTLWQHKALVLFDVVLIVGAAIFGHYI